MNTQTRQHLPPPSLPQLNNDGALSIAQIRRSGVDIVVPVYPGMQAGDMISAPWEGTPAGAELTFPQLHTVRQIKPLTLKIPFSFIHEGWKKLKVRYNVRNNGVSEWVEVDIVP